jgi:uncharacterized protein (DUF58 family)
MISLSERVAVSLKTLVDLAAPATGLKFHHRAIRAKQSGGFVSRFKGRGMEFDETRLYQAGDDIRSIDWRVTARTGKTHTKIFREERERPVFISVDCRAAMHFATRGVFKSVLASKLAALLAWTACHHGDRIGGQLFFDSHCQELKPKNGRSAVLHFLNALVNANSANVSAKFGNLDNEDLELIFSRLQRHARAGSLVYIISDFHGLTTNAQNKLTTLARHCDVVLWFIYDELEQQLPPDGQYRFSDGANEAIVNVTANVRLQYHQQFLTKQDFLQNFATQHGMIFKALDTRSNQLEQLLKN